MRIFPLRHSVKDLNVFRVGILPVVYDIVLHRTGEINPIEPC